VQSILFRLKVSKRKYMELFRHRPLPLLFLYFHHYTKPVLMLQKQ
jgi:hypothetical protein